MVPLFPFPQVHAGTAAHYFGGGFYPVGGPQKIVDALIPTIEKAGGRVLVKAAATSLVMEGGRCCGVVVNGEDTVRAKNVVVAAGCVATLSLLRTVDAASRVPWAPLIREAAPTDAAPAEGADGGQLAPGISHMYAFIGLDGTADELELRSQNLWVLPTSEGGFDFERRADECAAVRCSSPCAPLSLPSSSAALLCPPPPHRHL